MAEGKSVSFIMAAVYFSFVGIAGILESGKETLITIFGQKVTHRIRSTMSEKLLVLPAAYYVEKEPGVTSSRFVNDVNTIETLFESGVISMVADVCRLAGILAVIFTRSKGLGIMMIFLTPGIIWLTKYVQAKMLEAQIESRVAVGRVNQQIPETMNNMRTIRTLHREQFMQKRYGEAIEQGFFAQEKSNFYDAIYSPIIVSVSALAIGVMMAASAQNGIVRELFGMSAGTATALISYIGSFFEPLENIGMEIQNIQSAFAGMKRIDEFMSEEEIKSKSSEENKDVAFYNEDKENAVCMSGVHFRYSQKEREILENFSLTIKKGEDVILAGRTGAGKSTIIKLISGLYTPQKGKVLVFGIPSDQIAEKEKRKCFGYVEQQFRLITGTVGEQVSLKDPLVTEQQIEDALKTVGLWKIIEKLPKGIQTPCTENIFSQGQFQLLSIARAIVLNPKILLLDEITANLDSNTEKEMQKALRKASINRTVISVSHRLYEKNGGHVIYV